MCFVLLLIFVIFIRRILRISRSIVLSIRHITGIRSWFSLRIRIRTIIVRRIRIIALVFASSLFTVLIDVSVLIVILVVVVVFVVFVVFVFVLSLVGVFVLLV